MNCLKIRLLINYLFKLVHGRYLDINKKVGMVKSKDVSQNI